MKIFLNYSVLKLLIAIFLIFVGIFFYQTGVLFFPDSDTYLNMDIIRSLGYPTFLQIHRFIFGAIYLHVVVIIQLLFILYSCFHFVQSLKKNILQNNYFLFVIYVLLCFPLLYEFKLANKIMSEALAYPLYILSLSQLICGVFSKNVRHFYFGLLLIFSAIVVRGQFLFVVVVYIVAILIAFKSNLLQKDKILLLACTFSLPFIAIATDISYHYFKHDIATTTPWTGIQISTMPFFVADSEDAKLFIVESEKRYFTFVHKKISNKNLLLDQVPKKNKEVMTFYFEKYTIICNGTINADGETLFNNLRSSNEKVVANDKMSARMVLPLILDNYKKYIKMYLRNIAFGFGSNKYFLMYFFLGCFSCYHIIKNDTSFLWIVFIGSFCTIANIFLVSFAEPSESRYVFYNNWVLITIFMVLFDNIKYHKANGS